MFWEIYTLSKAIEAQNDAATANSHAASASSQAYSIDRHLTDRMNKLTLTCQAMWELMRDKFDMTEQMLMDKVKEIDLRESQLGGQSAQTVKKCPTCQHELSPRHTTCLYCGAHLASESAFK